jgi:hypothetical protein
MYNQNPDTGLTGGIIGSGQFGFRFNGMSGTQGSGVSPITDNWYRLTLTYDFANSAAMLDAFNLTAGSAVDLNGASAGNTYSFSSASLFNSVDPATYKGIVARASGTALVDNIVVTPVPEPSSVALLAGGFGMLTLLRRRSAA